MLRKIVAMSSLVLMLFSCGQEDKPRVEEVYMDCLFESFPNGEQKLQEILVNYENLLVEIKVLKDTSAQSYAAFHEKMLTEGTAAVNGVWKKEAELLLEWGSKLGELKAFDGEQQKACVQLVTSQPEQYNWGAKNYTNSLFYKLNTKDVSNQKTLNTKELLAAYEYNYTYYKLQWIGMFNALLTAVNTQQNATASGADFPFGKGDSEKAPDTFIVYMDTAHKVSLNGKVIGVKELKDATKNYLLNTENPEIVINADKGLEHQYIAVLRSQLVNAIMELRNQIAHNEYHGKLSGLSTTQQQEIEARFPVTIIKMKL